MIYMLISFNANYKLNIDADAGFRDVFWGSFYQHGLTLISIMCLIGMSSIPEPPFQPMLHFYPMVVF